MSKTSDHIQIKIKMPNPSQEPPASSKAPNDDIKDMDVLSTLKSRQKDKIWIMDVSKTSEYIQSKTKILNPSKEPPGSSKVQYENLLMFKFYRQDSIQVVFI